MPQIVVAIILAVLLVVLVAEVLSFAFQVLILSVSVIVPSVVVGALTTGYLLRQRLKVLNSSRAMSALTMLDLSQTVPTRRISADTVASFAASAVYAKLSFLSTVVGGAVVLAALTYTNNDFWKLKFFEWRLSKESAVMWVTALALIELYLLWSFFSDVFEKHWLGKIQGYAQHAIAAGVGREDALDCLQSEIVQLTASLSVAGITTKVDYYASLRALCKGGSRLVCFTDAEAILLQQIAVVRKISAEFSIRSQKATAISDRIASLRKTLDDIGDQELAGVIEKLETAWFGIANFATVGNWVQFDSGADMLIAEIDAINQILQDQGGRRATNGDDQETFSDPYAVLGLAACASERDVKAAYKSKRSYFHPDKGNVTDDTEFKRVLAAYKQIALERGF